MIPENVKINDMTNEQLDLIVQCDNPNGCNIDTTSISDLFVIADAIGNFPALANVISIVSEYYSPIYHLK
jgi:hypothetical protein